jgi:hypothetical protein
MVGLIAIEEAMQIPELAQEAKNHAPPGEAAERLAANLVDIHNQRLKYMDEYNVDMEVPSLACVWLTAGSFVNFSWCAGIIR